MTVLNWGCLLSQTGKELYDISTRLNIVPRIIVTNNVKKLDEKVAEHFTRYKTQIKVIPFRPAYEHYIDATLLTTELITLHGYLRILPKEFIEAYSKPILNGHPGLINLYPELKGKDPQIKAWKGTYSIIGSVIHRVTPEVDEGEILMYTTTTNNAKSLDEVYSKLKETSLVCWLKYLQKNIVKIL